MMLDTGTASSEETSTDEEVDAVVVNDARQLPLRRSPAELAATQAVVVGGSFVAGAVVCAVVSRRRSSKAARAMLCAPSFFGEGFMAFRGSTAERQGVVGGSKRQSIPRFGILERQLRLRVSKRDLPIAKPKTGTHTDFCCTAWGA